MFIRLLTKLSRPNFCQITKHGPCFTMWQELPRTLSGSAETVNRGTAVQIFPLVHKNPNIATKNNFQISISKIDPDLRRTKYKAPSYTEEMNQNFVFGFPVLINPAIRDPMKMPSGIISDPTMNQKPEIQAHKKDKYWRRRGMKHHRYMRWRKRNETLLRQMEERKSKRREMRYNQEIENIWKNYGLEKEPPVLSDEEKRILVQQWKEEGIWTGPLTTEQYFSYFIPPLPKNRKILPKHRQTPNLWQPQKYPGCYSSESNAKKSN